MKSRPLQKIHEMEFVPELGVRSRMGRFSRAGCLFFLSPRAQLGNKLRHQRSPARLMAGT
jgi:hypothetical protein